MPKEIKDFPRPPSDNGRGLHGSASTGWSGGTEGYDYWISELAAMGIKWFKVLDDGGDSIRFCENLLAAGIFPIVRIIRQDPPPNDIPEPNPGHVGAAEEETIKRLIAAGVRYFETNNEPNQGAEWKHNAMPGDTLEAAKLVALNWLFDARMILEAGGLPGLPAISAGGEMDLMGALVALGRQDVLLDGCWIALHNYSLNHPLGYPDEPVNRNGAPLTPEHYDQGMLTQWTWWNNDIGRAETLDEVNREREMCKNPAQTIVQDHACFREFEYYNHLAVKYLGRAIPIISTEGGMLVGRREDPRYPRVTPDAQCSQTVAMFDFMQRQAPDYYFAATPWLLLESAGCESDAWNSSFWRRAAGDGTDGRNGIPPIALPGIPWGERLPVIDAVKAMPNLARRLPGIQPAPPMQAPVVVAPPKPEPFIVEEEPQEQDVASWLPSPRKEKTEPVSEPSPVPPTERPTAFPSVPPPPPPVEPKEPAPVPAPVAPHPSLLFDLPTPSLDWDPRLDALNVRLEMATISPGQLYWKLIRAEYQTPDESNGKHHIYYQVQNEKGEPEPYQRVWQGWPDDKTDATTNEQGETNIPIWASYAPDRGESGPYMAWLDGLPSDRVVGMGLPQKRQVSFRFAWQRVIA